MDQQWYYGRSIDHCPWAWVISRSLVIIILIHVVWCGQQVWVWKGATQSLNLNQLLQDHAHHELVPTNDILWLGKIAGIYAQPWHGFATTGIVHAGRPIPGPWRILFFRSASAFLTLRCVQVLVHIINSIAAADTRTLTYTKYLPCQCFFDRVNCTWVLVLNTYSSIATVVLVWSIKNNPLNQCFCTVRNTISYVHLYWENYC